jgi:3-hydroxybutyryl-CoA dehydrogenase
VRASDNAVPGSVAVVGAGTMGPGIAIAFALGGCRDVRLIARQEASFSRSTRRIATSLALLTSSGLVDEASARQARGSIHLTTSIAQGVAGCALVIESISEDLEAKRGLLAEVQDLVPSDAILSTNTSALSIDDLSRGLARPEGFAGFHWLNPAEFVPLVEVVSGSRTADTTVKQLVNWARGIAKVPIHVRHDAPGFVVNRLQYALLREAFALVEAGIASYAEVDSALRNGLGTRWAGVGPFETMDLAGLEVHATVARRLYPQLSNRVDVPTIVDDLVGRGALGAKTGEGLRGEYSDVRINQIIARRDKVLLAMARLLRDAPEDEE